MSGRRLLLAMALLLGIGLDAAAQSISNWSIPPTWNAPKPFGGITALDLTPPLPFIGLAPCRIADTRGNGFTGAYGPPALTAGSPRNFALSGQCGVAAGAGAVSLNITVTNTAGPGFIKIFPQGSASPTVSTLNYVAGQTIANAAVVPLSAGGAVTVVAGVSGTELIIDTNGYYAGAAANQGNTFKIVNSGGTRVPAIWGETDSASLNATGVYGVAASTTGITDGVWGRNFSNSDFSAGALGISESTTGTTFGVYGRTNSSTDNAVGTYGEALGPGGQTFGVEGVSISTSSGTHAPAGVLGVQGAAVARAPGFWMAGVRGESASHVGVLGLTNSLSSGAVEGDNLDGAGSQVTAGLLGAPTPYGVFAFGDIGATGAKPFVDPHPTDPTKVITYVALEGPEAGTYFRGRGRIANGVGVIPVPESFRLVTDEEGLTVQITPVGQAATVAVVSADLNSVIVRSPARELEFYYVVNGVRRNFKDWEPIVANKIYVPAGPHARMPLAFSDEQKRALVTNGTYNRDGTVNMETAERLGWTKAWAQREAKEVELSRATAEASGARK